MDELYYLQDSRTYVGNDVLWWGEGGCGYTTDLRKAEVYTKERAVRLHNMRETDIPWPKDYIDSRTRPAVDMQYINIKEALTGTGIELKKKKKLQTAGYRCPQCGKFLSEHDYYAGPYGGDSCKHCQGY